MLFFVWGHSPAQHEAVRNGVTTDLAVQAAVKIGGMEFKDCDDWAVEVVADSEADIDAITRFDSAVVGWIERDAAVDAALKRRLIEATKQDTDWSLAADRFIEWLIENDFNNTTYKQLLEFFVLADDAAILDYLFGDETWGFFFGYIDDYERFAADWVAVEDRNDYLKYCYSKEGR